MIIKQDSEDQQIYHLTLTAYELIALGTALVVKNCILDGRGFIPTEEQKEELPFSKQLEEEISIVLSGLASQNKLDRWLDEEGK